MIYFLYKEYCSQWEELIRSQYNERNRAFVIFECQYMDVFSSIFGSLKIHVSALMYSTLRQKSNRVAGCARVE